MRLVVGPLSWLSHAPILARLPLTSSVGTLATGAAAIAAATATGVIDPHAVARAAPPALTHPVVVTRVPAAAAHPSLPRAVTGSAHGRRRTRPPAAGHARSPKRGRSQGTREPQPWLRPGLTPPAPRPAGLRRPAAVRWERLPRWARLPSPLRLRRRHRTNRHRPPPPHPRHHRRRSRRPGAGGAPLHLRSTTRRPSPGGSRASLEDARRTDRRRLGHRDQHPAPPTKPAQTVNFTVSASNPGLFSVQPAVAPERHPDLHPAANANGAATITVSAHDNGGTTSGGIDTSAAQYRHHHDRAGQRRPELHRRRGARASLEDAGAQTVAGWATAISPAPPTKPHRPSPSPSATATPACSRCNPPSPPTAP